MNLNYAWVMHIVTKINLFNWIFFINHIKFMWKEIERKMEKYILLRIMNTQNIKKRLIFPVHIYWVFVHHLKEKRDTGIIL